MGEKRSHSDVDDGAGKRAKTSSGCEVARSKAKDSGSAVAPLRGKDQEGNAYWEVRLRRPNVTENLDANTDRDDSCPKCAALESRIFATRR